MNAFMLHEPADRGRTGRWLLSAAAIVAAHVGLIAAAVAWYQQANPPGVDMPAITVDMAPAASAPTLQSQDLAPGPQMQQASAAPEPLAQEERKHAPEPPEPARQLATPQPEPLPMAPKPDVTVPVQAKQPPRPETGKAERLKRDDAKRKLERAESKHAAPEPPAPRTSAAPKAERQASLMSSPAAGQAAAAAALPSYRDRLAAHLARFKQYPSAAKAAREEGVAMLSFTVGRGGQVLGSSLARSSGHASLDAETMAMIRRAQPLPPFPPELTQASLGFTVPVRFSLH